jgi:hypothetical protein
MRQGKLGGKGEKPKAFHSSPRPEKGRGKVREEDIPRPPSERAKVVKEQELLLR